MTPRAAARAEYPRSKGYQRAFINGANAKRQGKTTDACPYRGRAHGTGATGQGGTFTFAWRAAWLRGFRWQQTQE